MRTPAQIAGHPVHPMLVTLPIGMWLFSIATDLIGLRSANPDTWHAAAFYAMVGGVIGALAAAVPGFIDLLSLRDAAIKRTAEKHMGLNLTIVVIFAVNAWMRSRGSISLNVSILLSVIAIAMLLVSGWLGGKMVYEAGVAVHAADTAASTDDAWTAARGTRSGAAPYGAGIRGERAMAADSERPSRETGETRGK